MNEGQHRRIETRRRFLGKTAATAAGLAFGSQVARTATGNNAESAAESPTTGSLTKLTEHLAVFHGPINVGIVRHGDKALLIDCGDASVAGALDQLGITSVDQIIFTHHHRDQGCGAHVFVADGARLGVPIAERDYFDNVSAYWENPRSRWHLYNQHPHHLMLAESVPVDRVFGDGQEITWGPARIRVLSTPGHTDGSVSYLVEVDDKRIVFSGDVIYDEGQVWDVHSLQKGVAYGDRKLTDYHGFLGAKAELVDSLGRIKAVQPETLVPSHGRIMSRPSTAVDTLVRRLASCYDKYVAISALRFYFPQLFEEFADRKDHMPIRPGKPVPECLVHTGTTWMLVAEDKSAFVMDCGNPRVVTTIKKMLDDGEIRSVEGLWVTHYHDDHVDAIPEFQRAFDCPCITDRQVAQVVGDPLSWRIPCISPSVARVDRPTDNGDSWQWHEFKLTAYHFPGQTLYHSGLFVEGRGMRMFFVGDSFTPGGIDDYCAHNRNWLGAGVGFDRCVALIQELRPTHVFNCHVSEAFDFTPDQCRFMRKNLAEREKLFGQLVPWEHPNYGMDEPWVRLYPYEQNAKAGDRVDFEMVVTNHSTQPRTAACRAILPRAWQGRQIQTPTTTVDTSDWPGTSVEAKSEATIRVSIEVPADAKPGRHVIPLDLRYGPWTLPQFSEAIVVL